jgi:dynein heavy chain 2
VSGVSKDNINELKNFANPPANVKLALEPVIALLLNKSTKPEWAEIKAELKKETFKNSVLLFDKDKIGKKCSAFISSTYLKTEGSYNIDAFFNASKAAGPLAMWLKSII